MSVSKHKTNSILFRTHTILFFLFISSLLSLCTSRRYTTGLVTVVQPDTTSARPETHNASISMTINDETGSISFHITRYSDEIVWTGFAFEYPPYNPLHYHNNTYAIILEYDLDNNPTITEWTLGYKSRGTPYTSAELTTTSDITHDHIRTVSAHRPLTGTFTFPSGESALIVMAAFSNGPAVFTDARHQGNADDRNHTTVNFVLIAEPTANPTATTETPTVAPTSCPNGPIAAATVLTDDLTVTVSINCHGNTIKMDIFYAEYSIIDGNWFGLIFNDTMFGDALVYTIGKASDRALRLYTYHITGQIANDVVYNADKDWMEISETFDHGLRIVYEQDLSKTLWSVSTERIGFRYAIGNDLRLVRHVFRSDDVFTLHLETVISTTVAPVVNSTISPSQHPSLSPSISPITTTVATTLNPTETPTTLKPTVNPTIVCPNGDVMNSSIIADDLIVSISLNCVLNTVTLDIIYNEYNDNWFGLVFNDKMYGVSAIYTNGKEHEDLHLGLHSYDISANDISSVVYNADKQWTEVYTHQSTDGSLRVVYNTSLHNTPWDKQSTTSIVFRYAIGNDIRLDKHIYTSDVFIMDLNATTTTTTKTPTFNPTTLTPTANPTSVITTTSTPICPNGYILNSSIIADDLIVSISLNCALDTITLDIIYDEYSDNWFGLVFNDKMYGVSAVYTNGKEHEDLHLGLHSYDISAENISNVVYNADKQWTEVYTHQSIDGSLRVVYSTSSHNTPWDTQSTTSIVFRYAIGNDIRLDKHIYTSNVFIINLTPTTDTPTVNPTLIPTVNPTIVCPNGYVLNSTINTDDLVIRFSLNCVLDMIILDIVYDEYDDNWFGLVFNDKMYGVSAVYTSGKEHEDLHLGLHSYDISAKNISNVVYNADKQWTEIYTHQFADGPLRIVYSTNLHNTPWDKQSTTSIVFRYVIGNDIRLDKHIYTSDVFIVDLTVTETPTTTPTTLTPTLTPTLDPTQQPSMTPTVTKCPNGAVLSGNVMTEDLMIMITILCDTGFVNMHIRYANFDNNWFGLVFNDEMSGYAVIYTTGKYHDHNATLYSYNITSGYTIDNVEHIEHLEWHEMSHNVSEHGLHIEYGLMLVNTPWNESTMSIEFRYAIGNDIQLDKHNFTSLTYSLQLVEVTLSPTLSPTVTPYNTSHVVVCNKTNNCIDADISCQANGGECILECNDRFSCGGINYICAQHSSGCHIECNADHSCLGAVIHCPSNTSCSVIAMNTNSLENAVIYGAMNSELMINCSDSINGCKDTKIDAFESAKLVIDCRGTRGCMNINIYCPPYTLASDEDDIANNIKNCHVIGDGYGPDAVTSFHDSLTIYALNSWDDIDLSSYLHVHVESGSKMFCGEHFYGGSCDITNPMDTFEWNCIDTQSECYRSMDSFEVIACNEGIDGDCYDTIIDCNTDMYLDGVDISQYVDGCRIRCNGEHSCSHSLIKCFDDKPCIIECNGEYSCSNKTKTTLIQCPNHSNCEVQCNGAGSCQYSSIVCADNNETVYQCNVSGYGYESAKYALIQSGDNAEINVECVSSGSCNNARFDAVNASLLSIVCENQDTGSCEDIQVGCPPYNKTNKEQHCVMIGGGEHELHMNLTFYCENAWNDINLDGYVGYLGYNASSDKRENKMYCNTDYSGQCTIYSLERDSLCQCPQSVEDPKINWVIVIVVGICALFVVLIATIIICGLWEKETKKYTQLSENDNDKIMKHKSIPSANGTETI